MRQCALPSSPLANSAIIRATVGVGISAQEESHISQASAQVHLQQYVWAHISPYTPRHERIRAAFTAVLPDPALLCERVELLFIS